MTVEIEKTVREVVLEIPAATRVFEGLGIDYCCGRDKNLPLDQVLDALETSASEPEPGARDWQVAPLAELIAHIQNTHHVYTRNELARFGTLLAKVISVHAAKHPELLRVRTVLEG